MADDEDNVIHFAPRADAQDAEKNYVANPLNLRRELHRNALTKGLVGFDEFAQQIVLQRPIPRPNLKASKRREARTWTDADDTALAEHFNGRGFKRVGRNLVRDVIELEARSRPFHPLRDHLEALHWDGEPRLTRFLIEFCGAVGDGDTLDERTDSATYIQAVTRAFFISAVARVFKPGCKADCMLILEGAQGAAKSRLLRKLAIRDQWFSDSLPHDLTSKDARQHLAGHWLVEMGEIAQFRRSEIETVKSYLSCQFDKYRPPYGRSDVSAPRQCIFVGSTNSGSYLHDPTGNRRFWPIKVGTIRLAKVGTELVNQLWAEAVDAYRNGEPWWLSSKHERLAAREQQSRLELDPWHDRIAGLVQLWDGREFTTAEILDAIDLKQAHRDRSHEMRVGNVLRELGYARRRARRGEDGQRRYVYCRSEAPENEDEEAM